MATNTWTLFKTLRKDKKRAILRHIIFYRYEKKPGGVMKADHILICGSPRDLGDLQGCEIWLQQQPQYPACSATPYQVPN